MAISYKGQNVESAGQSYDTLYQTASLVSSSLLLTTLGGATTTINLSSLSGSFSGSIAGTASYALNGLPPGTSGQILQVNLSNQYQLQTQINSINSSASIDFNGRLLYYRDGVTTAIDYDKFGYLYDPNGVISVNFGNRQLMDSNTVVSIDHENRFLSDTVGFPSVDYANRTLYYPDGTTSALSYGVQNKINISGSVSITGSLSVAGTIGVVDLNFGAAPGTNTTTLTVLNSNVTNNSFINVYVMSTSSIDHNAENHKIFALYSKVIPENIVNNTSFDITGITDLRVNGIFKIKYIINN